MKTGHWIVLIVVISLLGMASTGCKTNPLADASLAFVETVGPEYVAYVEADPQLNADDKAARVNNVAAFRMLAEEANR